MTSQSRFSASVTALLVIVGLVLAYFLFVKAKPEQVEPRAAISVAPAPMVEPVQAAAPVDPAPPEVLEAKNALRAEYDKNKQNIPEDVAKPIDQDIGVIEGATADLLAALANEPDNENLKMMLIETYRNELRLLKKALHLSSEQDEEAPAESASSN